MIKECSEDDFSKRRITSWRRRDVDCRYPFLMVKKDEIVRFPYAILEVKLQTVDDSKPSWIEELVDGSLVERVEKFSKFIHGCAVLFPNIQEIPYWLPQMDVEIRKNEYNKATSPHLKRTEEGIVIDIPICGPTKGCDEENESVPMLSESSRGMAQIDIAERRIAIPVRVEPKVFFANERTFLSWLHFSIFIGGVGTAMMGLGDGKAFYSGVIFISVSCLFAFYALYLYFWRANKIRERDPGPYDDLYGPAVLVSVFLVAMCLSILFKVQVK
jgi:uncharacterized membrane protein YidH (DUF202 family)